MNTHVLALASLLLATASTAQARDERLTQRLYNPDEVVRIDGRMGVQATVAFAEDEHIENVAVGDAESWQITPNKRANLLFVKPLAATARTNMTVVTDRHTYYFDLIAAPRAVPLYALRFIYPASKPGAPAAGTPAAAAALNDSEREALDAQPVDPAQLNFAWTSKGAPKLLPQRIYDDGEATYAVWPKDVPVPAILVTNDRGDEGPVNFAVRGDTIVIDGVPQQIVLRVGRDRAQLYYKGPGPRSKAAATAAPTSPPAPIAAAMPVAPSANQPRSQ
jgi:type IV secretion system protein VirB9